jgi:hypothetical protein
MLANYAPLLAYWGRRRTSEKQPPFAMFEMGKGDFFSTAAGWGGF